MQKPALLGSLEDLGYTVKSFEYHPKFFGNWRADLSSEKQELHISSDRREGCSKSRVIEWMIRPNFRPCAVGW
jgi:hypothetical protein